MKITVVGGGNIGTQFAVHGAEKGHDITVFTSSPAHFGRTVTIVDKDGLILHEGDIHLATNDPAEAFRDADVVIITMPPTMMIPLAEIIYDNTDEHTMIGFVPGNGRFEFAFSKCIDRGNVFFGIDRVPAIARLTERGRTVCCSGYKDELYVAAIPSSHTDECSRLIENMFDIPCVRLPGFMALTLTPSNPILHTARLRTIFRDYAPGVTYEKLPLFYEEWDDESSELLIACDDEIREICRALPGFGLEHVVSEREFYHSDTAEEMTKAICGEESLKGLSTPSVSIECDAVTGRGLEGNMSHRQPASELIRKHMERRAAWRSRLYNRRADFSGGIGRTGSGEIRENASGGTKSVRSEAAGGSLIPDLHSRYFTADFPYGLTVIQQIGRIAGVSMPNIDSLIDWYDEIAIINDKLILSDYGITDLEDLKDFYLRQSDGQSCGLIIFCCTGYCLIGIKSKMFTNTWIGLSPVCQRLQQDFL